MKSSSYILSAFLSLVALAMQAQVDTICMNAGPSNFAVPYQAGHSYSWQVNGGQIVSNPDSNDIRVEWGNTPGLYEISVVESNEFGCAGGTSNYYIQLMGPTTVEAKGPSEVCKGEMVSVEAIAEGEFMWGDGKRSSHLNFIAEKDTVIKLLGLNSTCGNDTFLYNVKVHDAPTAQMSFIEDTIETGSSLNVYYTGGEAPSIEWLYNDRFISNARSVQIDFDSRGEQEIVQLVKKGQCTDTIRRKVYVEDIFKIFIPNAFTPNNDGSNDYFTFDGVGIKSFEAEIYNRWGGRLFEWNDQSSVPGWDGTYNGQKSKMDSYIYKIVVEDMSGKKHFLTSDFALIR